MHQRLTASFPNAAVTVAISNARGHASLPAARKGVRTISAFLLRKRLAPAVCSSLIGLLVAFASLPSASADAFIYSNTSTDTGHTITYASGPYTEIGDQITLGPGSRFATLATVQFYNDGSNDGNFDATLMLFDVGSPVGSLIASSTVTQVYAPLGGISGFNVNFPNLNVTVPDNLIFTVSVANLTSGLDLGLDMFEPPTIGSSDNTFAIFNQSGYTQIPTASENVFFQLQSAPEPSAVLLLAAGLCAFAALPWLRRRSSRP
jgi:hypothetical protein